jgi:hypothetical protein
MWVKVKVKVKAKMKEEEKGRNSIVSPVGSSP